MDDSVVIETEFKKATKLETGSHAFNSLLFGGLATSAVTDVYGAAAAGKTQFAFQNALFTSMRSSNGQGQQGRKPEVVFVDCAGSFRPERIAEMAESRGVPRPNEILEKISSIYVRSVKEQREASERILDSENFDHCKLIIVDDLTTNFAAEYVRDEQNPDVFISRYYELASYARKLSYIALSRRMAVLLTNSVRSKPFDDVRDQSGKKDPQRFGEVETMGEILSQFALFRLHFSRRERSRRAKLVHPFVEKNEIADFNIETRGIVP